LQKAILIRLENILLLKKLKFEPFMYKRLNSQVKIKSEPEFLSNQRQIFENVLGSDQRNCLRNICYSFGKFLTVFFSLKCFYLKEKLVLEILAVFSKEFFCFAVSIFGVGV